MTDLADRLAGVLSTRYQIKRPLGSGGMADVFLARDLAHGREVAIKVLRPEIGAALGKDRFLREVHLAAVLNHPHIVPLFDSGEADGLLYYVMPYLPGPSLAERLEQEGQLPLDEAFTLIRQVALALHHAHEHGIVHRDIKPGNIMLNGPNAVVTDFGIAQAMEVTGHKLTMTGMAVGTPAYMSPEQASGERVDRRSDIYSLGCVFFEMLVGEPPFTGRSAQVVLARHSADTVPSARAVRNTIPPAVEAVIGRALAKSRADRFRDAREFAGALAIERLTGEAAGQSFRSRTRRGRLALVGALAAVAVVAALVGRRMARQETPPPVPDDVVAVLPFRTAGVGDARLTGLADAMAAGVAQRLSGATTVRALLSGSVAAALREVGVSDPHAISDDEAMRVARRAGAGLLLVSELGRIGNRVHVTATLHRAPGGAVLLQITDLSAPEDSALVLMDRVAAYVLSAGSGQPPDRHEHLVARALPEVRDFLLAERALLRGNYPEAVRRYTELIEADSTFALAALGLATAGSFVGDVYWQRGVRLARAGSLGAPDQVVLRALAGPRFPFPPSFPERIAAWERAVRAAPERSQAWLLFGEALFHGGPWTGAPDAFRHAAAAYQRALELSPGLLPALGHLIDLAAGEEDTTGLRALGMRYFAADSAGALADFYRWRLGLALGDARLLERVRGRFDSLDAGTLERIVNVAQLEGVGMEDAVRAAEALWTRSEWLTIWGPMKLQELALNRGRPGEAAAIAARRLANAPRAPRDVLYAVIDAIWWQADTAEAARLVASRGPAADRAVEAAPQADIHYDVCAVNLWRMSRGDIGPVRAGIAALRRARGSLAESQTAYIHVCAEILEAELAAAERRPGARAALERLDSLARSAPQANTWILATANLVASRLWEAEGEPGRALAAVRRRLYITDPGESRVLVALSTFFREEGRLALDGGDTAAAVRAYRKYLTLRADPEPVLADEVNRIREALVRIGAPAPATPGR